MTIHPCGPSPLLFECSEFHSSHCLWEVLFRWVWDTLWSWREDSIPSAFAIRQQCHGVSWYFAVLSLNLMSSALCFLSRENQEKCWMQSYTMKAFWYLNKNQTLVFPLKWLTGMLMLFLEKLKDRHKILYLSNLLSCVILSLNSEVVLPQQIAIHSLLIL